MVAMDTTTAVRARIIIARPDSVILLPHEPPNVPPPLFLPLLLSLPL